MDKMTAEQIRKSGLYEKALESAKDGDTIVETMESLLRDRHTRMQANKGHGEWLVSLALIIELAHKDVSPISGKYTAFEE